MINLSILGFTFRGKNSSHVTRCMPLNIKASLKYWSVDTGLHHIESIWNLLRYQWARFLQQFLSKSRSCGLRLKSSNICPSNGVKWNDTFRHSSGNYRVCRIDFTLSHKHFCCRASKIFSLLGRTSQNMEHFQHNLCKIKVPRYDSRPITCQKYSAGGTWLSYSNFLTSSFIDSLILWIATDSFVSSGSPSIDSVPSVL